MWKPDCVEKTGHWRTAHSPLLYPMLPRTPAHKHAVTSIHKPKLQSKPYPYEQPPIGHPLGLGSVYTPAAQSTLRKMDPRKRLTQALETSSAPFGHEILRSQVLEAKSSMKGFRLQEGMSVSPRDSLSHGRGPKQGALKHRARAVMPLTRNSISL